MFESKTLVGISGYIIVYNFRDFPGLYRKLKISQIMWIEDIRKCRDSFADYLKQGLIMSAIKCYKLLFE